MLRIPSGLFILKKRRRRTPRKGRGRNMGGQTETIYKRTASILNVET